MSLTLITDPEPLTNLPALANVVPNGIPKAVPGPQSSANLKQQKEEVTQLIKGLIETVPAKIAGSAAFCAQLGVIQKYLQKCNMDKLIAQRRSELVEGQLESTRQRYEDALDQIKQLKSSKCDQGSMKPESIVNSHLSKPLENAIEHHTSLVDGSRAYDDSTPSPGKEGNVTIQHTDQSVPGNAPLSATDLNALSSKITSDDNMADDKHRVTRRKLTKNPVQARKLSDAQKRACATQKAKSPDMEVEETTNAPDVVLSPQQGKSAGVGIKGTSSAGDVLISPQKRTPFKMEVVNRYNAQNVFFLPQNGMSPGLGSKGRWNAQNSVFPAFTSMSPGVGLKGTSTAEDNALLTKKVMSLEILVMTLLAEQDCVSTRSVAPMVFTIC